MLVQVQSYISAYRKDFDYAAISVRETASKLVCISPAGAIAFIIAYSALAFFSINLQTRSYISAYHKDFDYAAISVRETNSKLVCISPAGAIALIHTYIL